MATNFSTGNTYLNMYLNVHLNCNLNTYLSNNPRQPKYYKKSLTCMADRVFVCFLYRQRKQTLKKDL